VTSIHPAECRDPVCPLPHGIWTTTPDATLADVQAAQPLLEAAAARGDTFCWVGSRVWTWVSAQTAPRPAIDRELLADAIFMHRLGQYQRSDALESSHLCFEDCAEDIAAHYGKAAR
jgi:hypothetical protein